MNAILTVYNSRLDTYGNCYWAVQLENEDSHCIGTIGANNVRTLECRETLGWLVVYRELPIKEFNQMVKNAPYFGSSWDEIKANLQGGITCEK